MVKIIEVELNDYKNGVPKFYENVAKKLGVEDGRYDCTKIDIAKNIQDYWFEYYENEQHAAPSDVCMMLLMMGPKVDESLSENKVVIYQGFISNK